MRLQSSSLELTVNREDLWNDFAALHQNKSTDLERLDHRNYFGETPGMNRQHILKYTQGKSVLGKRKLTSLLFGDRLSSLDAPRFFCTCFHAKGVRKREGERECEKWSKKEREQVCEGASEEEER